VRTALFFFYTTHPSRNQYPAGNARLRVSADIYAIARSDTIGDAQYILDNFIVIGQEQGCSSGTDREVFIGRKVLPRFKTSLIHQHVRAAVKSLGLQVTQLTSGGKGSVPLVSTCTKYPRERNSSTKDVSS
jgi:hypothetical protein